ncbi:class I SAM-dependent methyltransferase [Yoonia sediminilitoris]|uniref:Ubiquinone/menaquinone biosynthesis C-methylase UbiE n=1 Tax=Yoonia sediminilitoris TaxID=1286148 RepID=A0A2T6K4F5_9RHOB|nr:class I SAM-dependent methyltransferase [Yoonia sediminilitoris]PUB09498.1 ubiquinone/menaquinone biosynthesis C-methylase UbiE [Yoonia sediminilitoris]RCW89491.1 ubiquinone/menaquinone biosynthesis C-methylase UbiE [Yoonia sediminilitoris]
MEPKSSDFSAASGNGYELQMGRFSRLLAPKFLDFIEFEDSDKILDAGCGTGALTAELLRRTKTAKIVGIDISEAYVEFAACEISNPRVSFEAGDLNALLMPDEVFDHVVSQLVLDFVPNTSGAFSEISRILKPGGRLAVAVWDARGGLVFNRFFLDTAAMLDREANELRKKNFTRPLRRPGRLEEALRSAGFAEVQAGEIHIRTEFASFEDYWSPFDGTDGPIPSYLSKRSPELKNQIKDAVRDAYLDGEADGPRSYVATAWIATGRRQ